MATIVVLHHKHMKLAKPFIQHAIAYSISSVATSHVSTSDLMFSEKFLMSDVWGTNLTLTGLLFLFSTFPLILG